MAAVCAGQIARPVRADGIAEAMLERCIVAEGRANSLQAGYRRETRAEGRVTVIEGSLQLRKPNMALVRIRGAARDEDVIYRSDSLNFVTYHPARNEYVSQAADAAGHNIESTGCLEAALFFNPELLRSYRKQGDSIAFGRVLTVGGRRCTELIIGGGRGNATFHLFIGPDDLLQGLQTEFGARLVIDSRITDVRVDAALPQAALAWRPPDTARPSPGSVCRVPLSDALLDPALTQIGRTAPDFPLSSYGPAIQGLFGLLQKHRVVLLSFWGFG